MFMLRKHPSLLIALGLAALLCGSSTVMAQTIGNAQTFAIVGEAINANGAGSTINGNIGAPPGAGAIIGFPANATILTPFINHAGDSSTIAARADLLALYNSAVMAPAGAASTGNDNLSLGGPGGNGHYTPGRWTNPGGVAITSTNITLDGPGIYVFTLANALTVSNNVILNGVDPCTVFWRTGPGAQATLNGLLFSGTVVSDGIIALGAGVAVAGRTLTTATGSVTLAGNDTIGGCSGVAALPSCEASLAPTITPILNQAIPTLPVGGSVAVGFTISGAIITDALVVSATSSNTTLVPPSAMVITKGVGGARVLTIVGADGRTGISTITVTVTDPTSGCVTSTSFLLTVGAVVVPTLPQWAMIALTVLLALAGFAAVRRRAT